MSSGPDIFERRAFLLAGFGGLAFTALGLRMAQLQIIENKNFRKEAADNQFNLILVPASRGPIYDRFGIPLAVNRREFRVMVVRDQVGSREELFSTIDQISSILGKDAVSTQKVKDETKTAPRFQPTQIASKLSWEEYSRICLYSANYPGILPQMGEGRNYPLGESFAHLLGYVAKANPKEIEADPEANHPGVRVGKEGLEKSQEKFLRGKHGANKVEVTARGKPVREVFDPTLMPIAGEPIVLTIDAEIQQIAYDQFNEESGSAVVIDIKTGEILALASAPSFDPNKFVDGINSADYAEYTNNEMKPLFHKAVRGTYPAGSTFKTIMSIAALEAGVVTPEETIFCPGSYLIGSNRFHCGGRHGNIAMHNALKVSCDVYYYELGRRMGGEKMAEVARRYGLGQKFDLGIPGISAGIIPDAAWKMKRVKTPWAIYDNINMVIGQGYVSVTSLQLAVMCARIASFGKEVIPRLIKIGPNAHPEVAFRDMKRDIEQIKVVHGGMYGAANEPGGTANRPLGIEGVKIAGKTGTAQVRRISMAERRSGVRSNASLEWRMRDHGLFVCFGPYDNPRYACAVIADHGGGGGSAAAPKAREIMKAVLLKDPSNLPSFVPEKTQTEGANKNQKGKQK